jgi:hypothetical protein
MKNYHSVLLVFIILGSFCVNFPVQFKDFDILETTSENETITTTTTNPETSVDPDRFFIRHVFIENTERDPGLMQWTINGYLYATGGAFDDGFYSTYLDHLIVGPNTGYRTCLFDAETATEQTGVFPATKLIRFRNNEFLDSYYNSTSNRMMFCMKASTSYYLMNITTASAMPMEPFYIRWREPSNGIGWSRYDASGFISTSATGAMYCTYKLKTNLIIDSEFYNLNNIRVKIYSYRPLYSDSDYLAVSGYDLDWIETDPQNVILTNPQYKIQIYDLENNLIFADSIMQNFTAYRTITINSLKIQNNANERINVELLENAHYQGFSSFDLIPNGVYPTTLGWSKDGDVVAHVEAGDSTHQKILHSQSFTSAWHSTNFGPFAVQYASNVEFWIKPLQTTKPIYVGLSNGAFINYILFQNDGYMNTAGVLTAYTVNWIHIRYLWNATSDTYSIYINGVGKVVDGAFTAAWVNYISFSSSDVSAQFYVDAMDTSWSTEYYTNRNLELNYSSDLYNERAFEFENELFLESGHYKGLYSFDNDIIGTTPTDWTGAQTIVAYNGGHRKVSYYNHATSVWDGGITNIFATQTSGTIEFWCNIVSNTVAGGVMFYTISTPTVNIQMRFNENNNIEWYNATGSASTIGTYVDNTWAHYRIVFNCGTNSYSIYQNSILLATKTSSRNVVASIDKVILGDPSGTSTRFAVYYDAIDYSWATGYYIYRSTHTSSYDRFLNYSINPYSSILTNITANYLSRLSDAYNNTLQIDTVTSLLNDVIYTPPNVRECFISLADQSGNFLNSENFKIYINSSIIYENRVYREIDTAWNISIYSRFNTYVGSTVHTVNRDENWVAINITLYTLKIYNQQTSFLHYNITRDPTYYPGSTVFWSEWLSPNEVGKNVLYPDYYRIVLMKNETGTPEYVTYALNFVSDDVLLISSTNTIFAVLQNINNLDSSIETQFTYVSLNFTNTNSAIGNQTTMIILNFENFNTTFDDILLSSEYSFEFMNSSLQTLLVNSEDTFEFLNSSVNSIYTLTSNSFTYINSSVGVLITQCENSFDFLNSSVNTIYAYSQMSFLALNSSIADMETTMVQNFTFIESEIGANHLEVLTQFNIVNSNITNNSLDIMTRLNLVNSSIASLIADLESNVLLVNNSIYTAVLNVSTNLVLDSNNILGNISLTYEQNEFLTELFKRTMFSDLLNWTGVGHNYTLIENQIEATTFANVYRDENINLLLKYQNQIEEMQFAALETKTLNLPKGNVEYKVVSLTSGETLHEWDDVQTKNITIGTYEKEILVTPADIQLEIKDYLLVAIFAVVLLAAVAIAYVNVKSQLQAEPTTKEKISDTPEIGVRKSSIYYRDAKPFVSRKKTSKLTYSIIASAFVGIGAIMFFLFR